MAKFTSGFAFKEDGSKLFLVNTKYYYLKDDPHCFEMSCIYHKLKNVSIEKNYEIMRANIMNRDGDILDVWIDFNDKGKETLRVYKVLEEQINGK